MVDAETAKRASGMREHFHFDLFRGSGAFETELSPSGKLLSMVFLLALKDRASEIHFALPRSDGGDGQLQLFYKIEDELYDLLPAPQLLSENIVRDLKEMAGLGPERPGFAGLFRRLARKPEPQPATPKQGHIQLSCGQATIDMVAEIYTYNFGERILLTFSPYSTATSESAQQVLTRLMDRHRHLWQIRGNAPGSA